MKAFRLAITTACFLLAQSTLMAYPPALHHTFYGMVRDEFGNPITSPAEVFLTTSAGNMSSGRVTPNKEPGINYRLSIPMDAGLTDDLYKPTALRPTVPYKLKVKIGQVFYVPIEMKGDFSRVALPGDSTRINLTLGIDNDGDGLPDAWEKALLALRGRGGSIEDVNPNDDTDGDGLNNLNEYLAGAYAFDSKSGFALKLAGFNGDAALLDFTAVRGRAYYVEASSDFKTWSPLQFRIAGAPATQAPAAVYQAKDTKPIRVEALLPEQSEKPQFFRLMLQ